MAWVIGDIHGCSEELAELIGRIPAEDQLIFVGDYVDRGPDSAGVVDLLLKESKRSIFLMGNHESMMLAYFLDSESREGAAWTYWANGGMETLKSYGLAPTASFDDLPKEHQDFYNNLKLYHEEGEFIAVHAGLRINGHTDLKLQDRDDLLWIRMEWIRNEHLWSGKKVYYGHTPTRYILGPLQQNLPIFGRKSVGIDTGCVFGGALTAINPENGELVQIKAKKAHV